MSKMQNASLTCEMEVSSVALLAANEVAMAGSELPWKLEMNGPAKLLVTCNDMPSEAEKTKNSAMRRCLNSLMASSPKVSHNDFRWVVLLGASRHGGNVNT